MEMRKYPVHESTTTTVSFPDEQGVTHTLIQIPTTDSIGNTVLHVELWREGNNWNVRLEEWDGNAPDILLAGRSYVKMSDPYIKD